MLQRDNEGHRVAAQSVVRELDVGLFVSELEDLGPALRDEARMTRLRENVWRQRDVFSFDFHADRLVAFFREVIERGSRKAA